MTWRKPGKSALLMTLSDPSTDPRPNRNIRLLESEGFNVAVASYAFSQPFEFTGNHFLIRSFEDSLARRATYLLERTGLLKKWGEEWFNRQVNMQTRTHGARLFDVVVVEDLRLVKCVFDVPLANRVIFDAREFYPGQFPDTALYRMLRLNYAKKICEDYLSRCDLVLTVSEGLAELYRSHFGPLPITVVRSVPREPDGGVGIAPQRMTGSVIRLVYHGNANKTRKLENLVFAAGALPSLYTLDLFLNKGGTKRKLARLARRFQNVTVRDAVPHAEIAATLERYDIGISVFPPATRNLENVLPNKFFEYVYAGLAVIASPSRDQRELVGKFKFGFVTEDSSAESLIKLLSSLTPEEISLAQAKARLAKREITFSKEAQPLRDYLRTAL
jgi:glycosyltransferase involved in cell wall biosynthesis